MPLIARQRSRFAVLAVLALVGSLLAVSAAPAVAAGDEKPSAEAMYSACVAAATDDAGFTDMDGSFAKDAANCLAHYGVTVGTSEGVFSPGASITRRQMAIFMVRAAGVAGVEMDDTEDQSFTDIAGENDTIQDAINQAAALKIMEGIDGGDEFSPGGTVSRADMAVIVDKFLTAAGVDLDEAAGLDKNEDLEVDEPFGDLRAVSVSEYTAINRLYEFGVSAGTGDGSNFSPDMKVNRGQMAVFVTKALAHTNARPAGLSLQAAPAEVTDNDTTDLQVSLRDDDHQPVPDELVEVFSAMSRDDAFDDDGTCEKNDKDQGSIGTTRCEIDAADEATDPDGNVPVEVDTTDFCPGSMVFWAWTGEIGDEFDADETDTASTEISVSKAAKKLLVTSDIPENADFLEFGDSVTFTFQVANADDDPVAMEGLALTVRTVEKVGDIAVRTLQNEHKTDASGRVELTFSMDDPDSDKDVNNMTSLDVDLLSVKDGEDDAELMIDSAVDAIIEDVVDPDENNEPVTDNPDLVKWSDADAVAKKLTLSQSVAYHEASRDASGVRHTVQATLIDQYGDSISGAKIRFWSNALNTEDATWNDGLGGLDRDEDGSLMNDMSTAVAGSATDYADERTTNRRGVATKFYNRDAEENFIEIIGAVYVVGDPDANNVADDVADISADTIDHYWAVEADDGSEIAGDTAVVVDTDANIIVVTDQTTSANFQEDDTVYLVTYDSNDQFSVGTGDAEDAVTMSVFEGTLADGSETTVAASTLNVSMAADPGDGVNELTNTNGEEDDADPCA